MHGLVLVECDIRYLEKNILNGSIQDNLQTFNEKIADEILTITTKPSTFLNKYILSSNRIFYFLKSLVLYEKCGIKRTK